MEKRQPTLNFIGMRSVSHGEKQMNNKTNRTVITPLGEICYELERKRIKRLNLHVRRDKTVYLSVPFRTSCAYADKFVSDNAAFVIEARSRIAERTALDTSCTYFLGQRLKVEIKPSQKLGGELSADGEDLLTLFLPPDTENEEEGELLFKRALALWQKEKAWELLPQALELAKKRFDSAGLRVPYPSLSIRSMTSRWGSCAAFKNKVTLNALLVEKPFICMEQVACHELAHFIVPNHSANFYRVMDAVMPEHRSVNAMLKADPKKR
ncbi:MAG: M48 family metallopeptidase [Bacteroides sp.]|nr:M48 family metallopeptidase [Bacteroides sp.]